VNTETGLTGVDFEERTLYFGNNHRESVKAKSFFRLFLQALDDIMLKVLLVCAVFSICFDMILAKPEDRGHAWVEGFAILVAVLVVSGVGAFVDWRKEHSFVASRTASDEKNVSTVLRDGEFITLHHNYLHVGDVMKLSYGCKIPVDGVTLRASQF